MKRDFYLEQIHKNFNVHPITALLGARQVGKTTLAHMYKDKYNPKSVRFFDLEDPLDLAQLDNPMLTLSTVSEKLIVIDEIQIKPELFPILRVLVDKKDFNKKILILGSASRELIRQSSESLAGRIGYIELPPFALYEVKDLDKLWQRGGFPRSYLATNNENSYIWRQNYIKTFLEKDIPNLGFNIPPQQMRRFWLMLVHYHGQIFNASELARSLAVSDHTVKKYLDILAGTFMIRILYPWFEILKKRQVKTPKIYFRDSGILHALLGIKNKEELNIYPKLGAFWEGFALEEIIKTLKISSEECYFWSTQAKAELDLLIITQGKRIGFEFKYVDAPKITKSMLIAQEDLKLNHLIIIYPRDKSFRLKENIIACSLETFSQKGLDILKLV